VRFLRSLFGFIIIYLSVDSNLGLIFTPFSNEELVLIVVEITALSFTLAINPVAFKMISITLSQDTVTVALAFVPLTFINVFSSVNHTSFTLRLAIDPVSIVTISISVEEGTTSMASIFIPVTSVFTS